MSYKKARRNLRRKASRQGTTYSTQIAITFNEPDKTLLYSLHKKRSKGLYGKSKKSKVGKKPAKGYTQQMIFDKGVIDALEAMKGQMVYLQCEPETLDFTAAKPAHIFIMSKTQRVGLTLSSDPDTFRNIIQTVCLFIGKAKSILIGWNIKSFFSYCLYKLGRPVEFEGQIFDLHLMEKYLGISQDRPANFAEAEARLQVVSRDWGNIKTVYNRIHSPLTREVIPYLETQGIGHVANRKKRLHACYDIMGQVNGRMQCHNRFVWAYNPHNAGDAVKEEWRAPGFENVFLNFDFCHMEVNTLYWLTKDAALGELVNQEQDVYELILKRLSGASDCNEKGRKICKTMFLPVLYGEGVNSLSNVLEEKYQVPVKTTQFLYDRIRKIFWASLAWLKNKQDSIGDDGLIHDYFGRQRQFLDYRYKCRNFLVQSPAAIICLDKLIQVYREIGELGSIVFHLHDGYVLRAKQANYKELAEKIIQILEREDPFYPGLKLKVNCKWGENLVDLKQLT